MWVYSDCVPPLPPPSKSRHDGRAGRICILGFSTDLPSFYGDPPSSASNPTKSVEQPAQNEESLKLLCDKLGTVVHD